MLARERFLIQQFTLGVIGGVQPNRAMRALRQLLGSWRKSEQIVPATFRQPLPPDPRTLVIDSPADQSVEVRLAVRGFARNDADAMAATLLAGVARNRWEKALLELSRSPMLSGTTPLHFRVVCNGNLHHHLRPAAAHQCSRDR